MTTTTSTVTVRVAADGIADIRLCDTPRLSLKADEALELFHALDDELDRCYRCNAPVFLDLVGVCESFGAFCEECGHGSYRGCDCDRPLAVAI